MKEKHNKKKKLQIGLRRLYATKNPSKEILKYLSIDKEGFIDYINSKLLDGMTLENFGSVWGIDHVVPVELFDLNNEDDLRLCYHFINIIPMFNNDNRFKGGSVHFSVILLDNNIKKEKEKKHQNILLKLLAKCEEEILCRYNKYLLV
jgi:hypothetical protein